MPEEMTECHKICQKICQKEHLGHRFTSTRTTDQEERIILMKGRDRRALDFTRVFLFTSSSPEFITRSVRIWNQFVGVTMWCHGGNHSKKGDFWKLRFPIWQPQASQCGSVSNAIGLAYWQRGEWPSVFLCGRCCAKISFRSSAPLVAKAPAGNFIWAPCIS